MKFNNFFFSLLILMSLIVALSCSNQKNNDKADIINDFINAHTSYGEDSIKQFLSDSVQFFDASHAGMSDEVEIYSELKENFLIHLGLLSDEGIDFETDLIDGGPDSYTLNMSYGNLLFDEMGYSEIKIVENFFFENDKIKKIVLSEVKVSENISDDYDKLKNWYRNFYDVYEKPFEDFWLGRFDAEYTKSTVSFYNEFLEFEKTLKNDYKTSMSVDELAEASFLNNDYHGDYFRFSMTFKEYEVSEEEGDEDFENFSSYALFTADGSDLFTIPRNKNFTGISQLKPGASCYVYGRVTKFLTGELALEDVIVFTLK